MRINIFNFASSETVALRLDAGIRFFLYLLIFWLPYSSAAVEICVISSLILWATKRGRLCCLSRIKERKGWGRILDFVSVFRPEKSYLDKPICFFLAACAISVFRSDQLFVSFHAFFSKTLEWFVIYYLIIEVFKEKKHFANAFFIFAFTAFSTIADSFVQFYVTGRDIFNRVPLSFNRATAAFKHANSLGAYLTFIIPFALSLTFLRWKNKTTILLVGFFLFLASWSLVITFSRGAVLAVVVGVVYFFFLIKRQFCIRFIYAVLILVLCLYAFLPFQMIENCRLGAGSFRNVSQWRVNMWVDSLGMIADRPFTGHGLNRFMELFQDYRRRPQGKLFSPTYSHNSYLQLAAETGLIGLGCFLWLLITFFKKILGLIRADKKNNYNRSIVFIGLLTGSFAFLFHSFFDSTLYTLQLSAYFWSLIGFSTSLYYLLSHADICGKKIA